MNKFLTSRFQTLETVSDLRGASSPRPPKPQSSKSYFENPNRKLNTYQASLAKSKCKMCNSDAHSIRNCPKFLNMSASDRSNFVRRSNLCLNCLAPGHGVAKCTSPFNCSTCHSRHHSLLHFNAAQHSSSKKAVLQILVVRQLVPIGPVLVLVPSNPIVDLQAKFNRVFRIRVKVYYWGQLKST